MSEDDKEQQYNRSAARVLRLVLLALALALSGIVCFFAAVRQGMEWLVYAGVVFLVPFSLVVAVMVVWVFISNAWHISQDYGRWRAEKKPLGAGKNER